MTVEQFILREEGFKPSPYLCSAGIPTIGYGTTIYLYGVSVTLKDIPITQEYGLQIFKKNLKKYEDGVNRYVLATLTKNQRIALISLVYNIGLTNFKNSTLLKKLNTLESGNEVANEFTKWIYVNGKVSKGLARRRFREKELFLK